MKFFLFSLLVLLSFRPEAQALQCSQIIGVETLYSSSIEVHKSPNVFFIKEKLSLFNWNPFYFQAELNQGVLSLDVQLRRKFRRSSELSGSKLFEQAVKYFTAARIWYIAGNWYTYSDNYKTFTTTLSKGLSPPEAAFSTWTGRQARKYGYKYVTVRAIKNSREGPDSYSYHPIFSKDPIDHSNEMMEFDESFEASLSGAIVLSRKGSTYHRPSSRNREQ